MNSRNLTNNSWQHYHFYIAPSYWLKGEILIMFTTSYSKINVCKLKENETVNFRFLISACEMAWQWTDIICLKHVDDDFKNTGFIVKSCYLYNKLDCCNDWMTFPSYTSVAQSMYLMNNRKSCFWHCYYNLRYFWSSQICPRRLNLVTSLE